MQVGGVAIGGGEPVSVQSMTKTATTDVEATCAQVEQLAEAGADLVRVAVPTRDDTKALEQIVDRSPTPIIADVHFNYRRALEAISAGAAKIRLNPGNISNPAQLREVISAAADNSVAIRVGVNEGSVVERKDSARRTADMSRPLEELMADKIKEYLEEFQRADFNDIVLSAKSRDAFTTVAANRLLAERWDYPLHLGVTHAGPVQTAVVRSAAAVGTLLSEGIGDTIRLSFAGDPVTEVRVAVELLASLRLRPRLRPEIIACPTCGRVRMELLPIVEKVQEALADVQVPLTVAVMGCVVNGPGEADNADIAVCAAGAEKAVLYRRGQKIRTISVGEIVNAVMEETKRIASRK